MKTEISTSIEIDAPAEAVWEVLADTGVYPEWNPFIRSFEGELVEGGRIAVRIEPPGGRAMEFKPRLLAVEPRRELRWRGRLLVPGLFDGEHRFALEPLGEDRCRLTQAESFSGLLVRPLAGALAATEQGFREMNEALKLLCDGSHTACVGADTLGLLTLS
jgi:hypothetical protein